MARILVLTNGSVGTRMAGTGMRSAHLARLLARNHAVTLASPHLLGQLPPTFSGFTVAELKLEALPALERTHDILIVQGTILAQFPQLQRTTRFLVADLYNPYLFEFLEHARVVADSGESADRQFPHVVRSLLVQLLAGDAFLCSSARQHDLWIGMLALLGRVPPAAYRRDPALNARMLLVPTGVEEEPPRRTRPIFRGVHPAVRDNSLVLLWGGGIHNWLDPLTPIEALRRALGRERRFVLVFPGLDCPEQNALDTHMLRKARSLAQRAGLTDRHVIFLKGWVPYEDRQNIFLESDIGTSMHAPTLETRFAFRTRFLDYLWAGRPSIISEGDELGEEMGRAGAARVVPPGDAAAFTEALLALANPVVRERMSIACAGLRSAYAWPRVVQPLQTFCASPSHAPDVTFGAQGRKLKKAIIPALTRLQMSESLLTAPLRAWKVYREEGMPAVVERIAERITRHPKTPRPERP